MYLKKILGITLLLISSSCLADSVDFNITSWHSDNTYDYDNQNYGIGYTKSIDHHWSAKGGVYNNSFSKTSFYAGFGLYHRQSFWSFGADILGVTGYDDISQTTTTTTCEKTSRRHSRYRKRCKTTEKWNGFNNLAAIQLVIIPTVKFHYKEASINLGIIPISVDDLKGRSNSTRKRKPIEAITAQISYNF